MSELAHASGTLAEEARSACKRFLSSVLFVDDEIKMGDDVGEGLSATGITDAFAEESIVPSFYSCKHENQYEKILTLIRKTDVFVLDWKMSVKRASAEKDLDADADSAGGRGFFARKLIDAVRSDAFLGPRLIFIYTSEIDEVVKYLKSLPRERIQPDAVAGMAVSENDLEETLSQDAVVEMRPELGNTAVLDWVSADRNVRICAYFKDSRKGNHGVDQSRVLTEKQLASAVLNEYAKLHEGILPITLLRLLTTVRDNTRSLMAKFNARLDQAFVIDRAMTPEPLDADRMLVGMMLNSVSALNNEADMPWSDELGLVGRWLKGKDINFGKLRLNNKETNIQDLVNWQSCGYKKFLLGTWSNGVSSEKKENEFRSYERFKLLKDVMQVFSAKGLDLSEVSKICRDYAVLSQWKRIVGSCRASPVLTLGTVLRQKDKEEYYLCIQPSCDTYRVQGSGRDFLFLPLNLAKEKFDIVLDGPNVDIMGLSISKDVYDLAKFNFKPLDVICDTVVKASKNEDGSYSFCSNDNKGNALVFQWVGDIVETHALKIVHDYISKLGRVGIDQSEWLRRS